MLWRPARESRPLPAGFVAPCLAIPAAKPPAGPHWIHEIKHDVVKGCVSRPYLRGCLSARARDGGGAWPFLGLALHADPEAFVLGAPAKRKPRSGHSGVPWTSARAGGWMRACRLILYMVCVTRLHKP
jgi:hypothetical protein